MARTVGRRPDDALVAEVHRRTGGNPFFVEQAARLWQSGGPVEAIAPGVRDAVQQRLSPLPEAAVPGREFHRRLPAAVTAEPVSGVDRPAGEVTVLAAARPGTNATSCLASSRWGRSTRGSRRPVPRLRRSFLGRWRLGRCH